MDLIPSFIARKFGREKVEYLDERMAPVLSETYGIMEMCIRDRTMTI